MYPINYRGGWMQPVAEYVPEVRKSRPTWKPNSKLPDYGPVIDEAPHPRQSFEDRAKSYQKIQYSEPFHTATPVIEFVNEPHVLDPIESNENNIKAPAQSSLREPLHFHDTYDNQDTTERDWRQKKLKGMQSKLETLPNESTRVNVEELNELRDLGVTIPQRVNRSDTVKKAIQRQIDKLESTLKKNI